jgi:hypothetical protein
MKLNHVSTFSGKGQIEINKEYENFVDFYGRDSGLLGKSLPLFWFHKTVGYPELYSIIKYLQQFWRFGINIAEKHSVTTI